MSFKIFLLKKILKKDLRKVKNRKEGVVSLGRRLIARVNQVEPLYSSPRTKKAREI
jgi:hypothetical protein